jgi:hypothetical protein
MKNNKIGLLFTGYNTEEYIDESIKPWIEVRANNLLGYEFVICAVSVPFFEYKGNLFKDSTQEVLRGYYKNLKIDHLITEPEYIKEHVARDLALQYLLEQGVDTVILWDSDEIATQSQLEEILSKVLLERYISWFSIQYKNFVFDSKTHLIEPFCPPRIFRVNTNGYKLLRFEWDNNVIYGTDCFEFNKNCRKEVRQDDLPHKLIRNSPITHMTWMNNLSGKRKQEYQMRHFGLCSYKWDDINGLSFNEDYYKKLGQKLPETAKL